jgi:hypothetical protein
MITSDIEVSGTIDKPVHIAKHQGTSIKSNLRRYTLKFPFTIRRLSLHKVSLTRLDEKD